jgi:hypothetical protein
MGRLFERLRTWLLIQLAAGRPVAINLRLTRGLYLQNGNGGVYVNIYVDPQKETPGAPDGCAFYISSSNRQTAQD